MNTKTDKIEKLSKRLLFPSSALNLKILFIVVSNITLCTFKNSKFIYKYIKLIF